VKTTTYLWLADGTHVEILRWIDDHSRYAHSVTEPHRVTGPIVGRGIWIPFLGRRATAGDAAARRRNEVH
jgi:hypothetical protein